MNYFPVTQLLSKCFVAVSSTQVSSPWETVTPWRAGIPSFLWHVPRTPSPWLLPGAWQTRLQAKENTGGPATLSLPSLVLPPHVTAQQALRSWGSEH